MKRAISILLAVATMAFATSAMAATVGSTANRKGTTAFVADPLNVSSMPCFRSAYKTESNAYGTGDTVTFDVSNLTSGRQLTVITYKKDAVELNKDTVMYINEYTTTDRQTITYKVRDLDPGIYVLSINENGNKLTDFYYKIGEVSGYTVVRNDGRYDAVNAYAYTMEEHEDGWSIGFVGNVWVNTGDITIDEIAPHAGFKIVSNNGFATREKYVGFGVNTSGVSDNSALTLAGEDLEIAGGYSVLYGVTMYHIPEGKQTELKLRAEVDLDTDNQESHI